MKFQCYAIILLFTFYRFYYVFCDGILNQSLPFTDADQFEIFIQHNLLRQQVFPVGSNMECVIGINNDLINIAQSYADKCTTIPPSIDDLQQSCYPNPGIAISFDVLPNPPLPGDVVATFLESDSIYYNFTTNRCVVEGYQCNSYRQASWHRMTEIGCGRSQCNFVEGIDEGFVSVCVYSESFQTNVQPYNAGNPCDTCPDSKNTCMSNLCCGNTIPCTLTQDRTTTSTTPATTTTAPCIDDKYCGRNPLDSCHFRPGFFLNHCRLSCNNCKNDQCYDTNANGYNCSFYAKIGYCVQMPQSLVVKELCMKSCRLCR